MTSSRPFITLAVLAAPAVILAGCVAPAPVDHPGAGPASTSTFAPEPTEDDVLNSVDHVKAALDEWHTRWLDASCVEGDIPVDSMCSTLLDESVDIAASGADTFLLLEQMTGIPDDLLAVDTGFTYATWRGGLWREANCASVQSDECTELTAGLVHDVLSTHEFLSRWSR